MTDTQIEKYVNTPMECDENEREQVRSFMQEEFVNTIHVITLMKDKARHDLMDVRGKKRKMLMRKPLLKTTPPAMMPKPSPTMMYDDLDAGFESAHVMFNKCWSAPFGRVGLLAALNTYLGR